MKKTITRVKMVRAPKRNLAEELAERIHALGEAWQGKRTLRTHSVELPAPPNEVVGNDKRTL